MEDIRPTFSLEMSLELVDAALGVFDKLGVRLYLCFGGLIGALRSGQVIPWDGDLDFVFDATHLGGAEGINNIVEQLKEVVVGQVLPRIINKNPHGFVWDIQLFHSVANPYEGPWNHNNVTYGQVCLFPLYRDHRGWWHVKQYKDAKYNGWMFPHATFDPPADRTATLNGREFFIPTLAEDLLVKLYGDWKTPSKSKSTCKKEFYGKLPPTMELKQ